MAPPPVVMAAPTKKAAPMVVQAAPTKVAPAPRVVQAAPTKAPAPMIIESAPTKMAPAPMVIESAPTKMAHAPMVIESAPTKMAPAPMVVEAAHTKMDHAPMVIEAAPHMKGRYLAAEDEVEMQFEAEQFESETVQHATAAERGLGKKKKVAYVSQPMKVAPPPQKYAPTKAPAPIVMAAPTKKAAPVIIEAAPTKKGRYLAAEDEAEMQFEAEQFETEQYDTAAERSLGKKKKVTYVSQPMKVAPPPQKYVAPTKAPAPIVKVAPPPQKYVAPTKAPAPIVMAAPTKKAAPVIIEAAPTKKGRYLAAEDEVEMQFESEHFETEDYEAPSERSLGKKKKVAYVAEPVKVAPAPIMMAAPTKKAPPMIIEAAPVKKGRYLAAEDETEMQFETEQLETEDYETPAQRSLGKKKKATYVAEPVKMAPAPIMMAAPTKKAAPMIIEAAPVIIEAAPTKKGRYLAAEDETEVQFETEHP
ncbi:dense granule protein GRA11, putative [Eimeria praecox]|uniref:Dense granule protein GRA11, putative n=1 Tax=Eimeria praecox TaxID=51316 RepID=U6H7R0_9EIME|nr:dense granule protein GRA11, putative [Eimeria praecox]